jgi:flagellar biosynthesis/type III secretory pathway chaperone
MEDIINIFIDVIKKEIKYNKQLLELLIEEQKILISEDITAVEKNVKEQDYLINTIKKLEEVRIESVKKISEMFGVPEKNLRFNDIVELVQDQYSEEIFMLMEELK